MTEEAKPTTSPAPKQTGPQFIPKLKGKKVIIRLVTGGQPITGILEGYTPYEILIRTVKGTIEDGEDDLSQGQGDGPESIEA